MVAALTMASSMVVSAGSSASLASGATTSSTVSSVPDAVEATVRMADHACPKNMALVGKSCVDKYEGSLVEILADGSEVPFSPYQAPNGHAVRAVSRPGVVPQAHISMIEAKRACQASGKRLCHGDEWKAACKGPSASRYPYGNTRVAGACVDTERTSPMLRL
jgi:hypothetical protein